MLSILVFLLGFFKNFEHFPEPEDLKNCLASAGFDDDEIEEAMDWLSQLTESRAMDIQGIDESNGIRIYSANENKKLSSPIRGFIQFLENEGGLTAQQREIMINQLVSLPDSDINLQSAKLVGLMVLWRNQKELPAEVRENLLSAIHFEQTMQ